jgi:hypothetical protein
MKYKQPKWAGKDEDGYYKGIVEEIMTSKDYDILCVCNRRRFLWVFSLFNGYAQIGTFKIKKPNSFEIKDLVIAKKKDNKIVSVKKDVITVSNIDDIYKG